MLCSFLTYSACFHKDITLLLLKYVVYNIPIYSISAVSHVFRVASLSGTCLVVVEPRAKPMGTD
jgi:hypothetical protein